MSLIWTGPGADERLGAARGCMNALLLAVIGAAVIWWIVLPMIDRIIYFAVAAYHGWRP